MIHSKQHRGCRIQDPGTRGYRGRKTADVSHSAGTAHSAPSLSPWGSIRTARAPRAHRVRYLNNFPRRWSTGRGVVNGTWWALEALPFPLFGSG